MSLDRNDDPGRERLESIVRAALTVPSGDNCQPFFYRWTRERRLEILHREERARHGLNPRNHASLLSLGCAIELASIRSRSLGFEARFEPASGLGQATDAHWGSLSFSECPPQAPDYASAIETRSCDRREYRGGDLPESDLFRLEEETRLPVRLHLCPAPRGDLLEFILRCEEYLWLNERPRTDLLSWIRFDGASRDRTRDGLYWKNLGATLFESFVLRAIRGYPALLKAIWPFFNAKSRAALRKQLQSSAGLTVISADLNVAAAHTELTLIEAGRSGLRGWLLLNHSGYGVQPLSLSTMTVFDSALGFPLEFASRKQREDFARGATLWRKAVGLPENHVPVWAFRFGLASPLPESHRALRRELSRHLDMS